MELLPPHLIWGVDVAIKKLRPGAHFTLAGTNFMEWKDPIENRQPPSWEEIQAQMNKDKAEAEKWLSENIKPGN